jgi:hypothetical protein
MANLGDAGIGGVYIPPPDAEIQGSSELIKVDMYCEPRLSYLNTARLYTISHKAQEKLQLITLPAMHSSLQPLSVMASYLVPLINRLPPSPFVYSNFIGFLIIVVLTSLYTPSSKLFVICTQAHSRHTFVTSSVFHTTSTFTFAPAPMKGCKLH